MQDKHDNLCNILPAWFKFENSYQLKRMFVALRWFEEKATISLTVSLSTDLIDAI